MIIDGLIEPNIHPLLVHFAYALTVASALSMFVVSVAPDSRWRGTLQNAADWMMAFAIIAMVATIAAGFQAFNTVTHDGPAHEVMKIHRNWAIGIGAALFVLAIWRWVARRSRPTVAFSLVFLAAAGGLSATGWYGAKLVFEHGIGVTSLPDTSSDHEHDGSDDHEHNGLDHPEGDHPTVDEGTASETPAPTEGAYPETPEAVVDAFARALREGDKEAVRLLLLPEAIIAESGGAERSLAEYEIHHLSSDMAFTSAVSFILEKRDVIIGERLTTVISQSLVHGIFRDSNIHSRTMETMMLSRIDDRWRIAHIHWSSAPVRDEHEH